MQNVSSCAGRACQTTAARPAVIVLIVALTSIPGAVGATPLSRWVVQEQATGGQAGATGRSIIQVPSQADADVVLDLEQAIDVALDKSFGIFQLQQNFLQYAYMLEASRRALRTQVTFASQGLPNITQTINAQLIGVPPELHYMRRNSASGELSLSVYQPLITDGRISFYTRFYGSQAVQEIPLGTEVKNRSIQPLAGIGFTQPIFQYNQIRGQLRSNELSVERERLRYTEDELRRINEVTRSFYDLFQQQLLVEITAEDYRQSEINYITGLRRYQSAQEDEVRILRLKVDMANALSDLESQKTVLERRQLAFNRIVGLPLATVAWVESALEFKPIVVDEERALELAMQQRSDMRRQEIQLEQDHLLLKQTVSAGRPDLQFSANYSLTGNSALSNLDYDDPWSEHLSAALDADNRSPFTNVSLTVRIPLFDGGLNDSNVERRLSIISERERQIEETRFDLQVEVINRVRAVEGAMRLMEILEENLQIARTSYQISQQQYERGEINLNDLMQAQGQRRLTERNHLQAWITFEIAKADLKEITLWDWETNQAVSQRTTPPTPFEK